MTSNFEMNVVEVVFPIPDTMEINSESTAMLTILVQEATDVQVEVKWVVVVAWRRIVGLRSQRWHGKNTGGEIAAH